MTTKLQKIWKLKDVSGDYFNTRPYLNFPEDNLVEQGYFITAEQLRDELQEAFNLGQKGQYVESEWNHTGNFWLYWQQKLKQLGVEDE